MEPELPPPPLSASLPRWRQPTAPRIFVHTMIGLAVWFGELALFVVVVSAKGQSDNFEGAAANITLPATLAATVGGWIGFVYARNSLSDRGMVLLASWGFAIALGLVVLLAVQPSTAPPAPAALDAVARDFCSIKYELSASIDAVDSATTAKQLIAASSSALSRFDSASVTFHELAQRAAAQGAPRLASDFDALANDFTSLADAMRQFDQRRTDAVVARLAPVLVEVIHTPPISDRCG